MTHKPGDVVWRRYVVEEVSHGHLTVRECGFSRDELVHIELVLPDPFAQLAKVREELRAIADSQSDAPWDMLCKIGDILDDDSKWPKGGGE